jgi:hypothetical protein
VGCGQGQSEQGPTDDCDRGRELGAETNHVIELDHFLADRLHNLDAKDK